MTEVLPVTERQKPIEKYKKYKSKEFDERVARLLLISQLRGWQFASPEETPKGEFTFEKTTNDGATWRIAVGPQHKHILITRRPKDSNYERGRLSLNEIQEFELSDLEIRFFTKKERLQIGDYSYSITAPKEPFFATDLPRLSEEVYFDPTLK